MRKTVLLIHGLAETSLSMRYLAAFLQLQGYKPVILDYPSTKFSIEECTSRYLAPAIAELAQEESFCIVTHSMGGIMVRYYLGLHKVPNLERVVMLVPGHGGSRTMTAMKKNPLFQVIMGPAGSQSADDHDRFEPGTGPYVGPDLGIIAGCLSLDVIGNAVMAWPHDGKLALGSTYLEGMKDHVVLPVTHDSVLFDPWAAFQTTEFLKTGKFSHRYTRPSANAA